MKYLLVIYSSFQRVQKQNTPIGFSCIAVGNVGLTGARGYMYYVEVTPDQKVGLSIVNCQLEEDYGQKYSGGGLASEGEQIEIVEIPENTIDEFLMDSKQEKSAGIFMAMYWWRYLRNKGQVIQNKHCLL